MGPPWQTELPRVSHLFCELDPWTNPKVPGGLGIEIHLIVSDHPGGVLVKTSKKAQGAQSATPIICATGTKMEFVKLQI